MSETALAIEHDGHTARLIYDSVMRAYCCQACGKATVFELHDLLDFLTWRNNMIKQYEEEKGKR